MRNRIHSPAEYAEAAVVIREAAENMLARLDWFACRPRHILDIRCRVGFGTRVLQKRYPDAIIIALDQSQDMLKYAQQTVSSAHWVCADMSCLPVISQGFDLVIANLLIPWCSDIKPFLREWRRVLKPDGLFMFTSLGPDTLIELPQQETIGVNRIDMHDLGDELVRAGFADPVLDVEHFTLKYQTKEQLWHELQLTGMIAAIPRQTEEHALSLSYEVIYGHAWGPAGREYGADEEGVVKIPLSHLRSGR